MRFRPRRTLFLLFLVCLVPTCLAAKAAAADDTEIREQIAQLADKDPDTRLEAVEALGKMRDERIANLLEAYFKENLFLWKKQVVWCEELKTAGGGKKQAPLADPLTRQPLADSSGKLTVVDADDLRLLRPGRQERPVIANVLRLRDLTSPDAEKRLTVVRKFGDSRDPAFLASLEEIAQSDPDPRVRRSARESVALTRLTADIPNQTAEDRRKSVAELWDLKSRKGREVISSLLTQTGAVDAADRPDYQYALEKLDRYFYRVGLGLTLTNGLSLGSVLILMALGLSIIYGQMGVINMAHGELMMIGAYATYQMQLWCKHAPEHPQNWYYAAAFPFSFCAAAFVGWLIELSVVRHLYGRALETLLATWGVGMILIQAIRIRYGDNIGVNSPTWAVGSFEIVPEFNIPYARVFILALSAVCVLFVYLLMNYTRVGLKIRATVQGRETAETLGVATRRLDGFTFALGAGLAGISGWALTLIAGVTPDMGQNYVVDSFLVVVVGGVGKLAGSVCAGLGIGTINQLLEPTTFGTALAAAGLVAAGTSLLMLAVPSLRKRRQSTVPKMIVASVLGGAAAVVGLMPAMSGAALAAAGQTFALIALIVLVRRWLRRKGPSDGLWLIAAWVVTEGVAYFSFTQRDPLSQALTSFLTQDIRAIWARVLILMAVVVFIQWRPAGLFPPKGRLADV